VTVPHDPVITVAELRPRLAGPTPPLLIDVRWRLTGPPGHNDYLAGHLPGAVFLDLDRDLCGPPGPGGRHPLPDPAALQAALRRVGVRQARPIVVYDLGDGASAARTWWTLRWAGHDDVRVLDGGYPQWLAAGGRIEPGESTAEPGDFVVRPGRLPVADARAAQELARDGVLVDVRAPARYRGDTEPIDPVAGHIPGAVNLPDTELHNGPLLRPARELADALAGVGVRAGAPVGAYCGSGVTAAQTVLALHRTGRTDALLYVGSWSEWITDPDRPIATGGTP
jgi:thiosulfate/3-mercaptopyruvate sulfurtransferase